MSRIVLSRLEPAQHSYEFSPLITSPHHFGLNKHLVTGGKMLHVLSVISQQPLTVKKLICVRQILKESGQV